jgi:uncharacterized protein YndB with AHSA1/START domain
MMAAVGFRHVGVRADELNLGLTRVLPVPPAVAFEAFTEPHQLAKWWGPEGFTTPSMEFHPRVGASYRIEMQPPDGDRFYLAGEFREVTPPACLVFTFVWEDPDPDDVEMVVDVRFGDLGESTEVVVALGPFKTEARRRLHRDGWTESLDRLERLLSVRA